MRHLKQPHGKLQSFEDVSDELNEVASSVKDRNEFRSNKLSSRDIVISAAQVPKAITATFKRPL